MFSKATTHKIKHNYYKQVHQQIKGHKTFKICVTTTNVKLCSHAVTTKGAHVHQVISLDFE